MELIGIIILLAILFISAVVEKLFGEITPKIWIIGLVIAEVLNIMGKGICSWQESAITLVVMLPIIVYLCIKFSNAIGGGVVKVIWMCGAFLGRYTVFTVIILILEIIILCKIFARKDAETQGHHLMLAIPLVIIAVGLTIAITYCLKG